MLAWLSEYLGTVIAALVLLAVIIAVVISLARDKKAGRSTCGANCAHCAMAGSCHNAKKDGQAN
jgi:hypothetical protein